MSSTTSYYISSYSSSSQSSGSTDYLTRLESSSNKARPSKDKFGREVDELLESNEAWQTSLEEFWTCLRYDSSLFRQEALANNLRGSKSFPRVATLLSHAMCLDCGLRKSKTIFVTIYC